jgi:hypothetical protein
MHRALSLLLFMAASSCSPSFAEDRAAPAVVNIDHKGQNFCTEIRATVKILGAERAEKLAREAGISEARITAGKKCLQ